MGHPHILHLDALRAFAVLAVVIGHSFPEHSYLNQIGIGFLGVRLFFVLSGFLITGILLRCRHEAEQVGGDKKQVLKNFYIRRFLRIFPAYYWVLFIFSWLGLGSLSNTFLWHFFYLSNYYFAINGQWLDPISHFWSLAVEEQFYLFWPFLILFVPFRFLSPLMIGLIVSSPILRFALAYVFKNGITAKSPGFACMDMLGLGGFLAYLHFTRGINDPRVKKTVKIAFVSGWFFFGISFLLKKFDHSWPIRVALLDLSVALIFTWVVAIAHRGVSGFAKPIFEWKPFLYIGKISYGIYLYHTFMVWTVENVFHLPEWVPDFGPFRFLLMLTTSLFTASLSWYLLEQPLNRLKARFPYFKALS